MSLIMLILFFKSGMKIIVLNCTCKRMIIFAILFDPYLAGSVGMPLPESSNMIFYSQITITSSLNHVWK